MAQNKSHRLLWAVCLAALAAFAAAMGWLHYQQLCSPGGGSDPYTSDLGMHLAFAQRGMVYSTVSLLIGPAYALAGRVGIAVLLAAFHLAAVAVFACGLMVNETLEAAKLLSAEGIEISVINVHTIKPIDAACVTEYAQKCGNVVTVEEHSVIGGLGDAVADVLMGKVCCKFRKIGVNDQFGQSGKAADVLREYGLTADQIAAKIKETL